MERVETIRDDFPFDDYDMPKTRDYPINNIHHIALKSFKNMN